MTTNTAQKACGQTLYQMPSFRPRESVLVVPHGDGWLEVYAGKHVDVHIATMPFAPNHDVLAERLFEVCLPPRYRELYWPDFRRSMQLVRVIRPSDIALREWDLALLNAIREALSDPQDEVAAWTL